MSELDARSMGRLADIHPDLKSVVKLAFAKMPDGVSFIVTEGLRTLMRQSELVKAGASQTMKSRHLNGYAVDLAATIGGEVRWDWPLYNKIAIAMKSAAKELNIPLEWGGDWKSLKDGPHFQLPWASYPK